MNPRRPTWFQDDSGLPGYAGRMFAIVTLVVLIVCFFIEHALDPHFTATVPVCVGILLIPVAVGCMAWGAIKFFAARARRRAQRR